MASYAFTTPSARFEGQKRDFPPDSPLKQPYSPSQPLLPSSGRSGPPSTNMRSYEQDPAARSKRLPPDPSSRVSNVESEDLMPNPFRTSADPSLHHGSTSSKYALSPDPSKWGGGVLVTHHEADDWLHNPSKEDGNGSIFTLRGLANLGCLFILAAGLVALFAGYPMFSYIFRSQLTNMGGYNLGGINATGQVMQTMFTLIDKDTPEDAMTYISAEDGSPWELVFSDEFEVEGRTFWPGDDPFWEAVDLHYWGTNNLEWYTPDSLTTRNGALEITLENTPIRGLNYAGGMMSTWNKFCFTGGILLSRVILPGRSDVYGLWPAVWTMGNLGRAGYGATADGMWPYTYEACDVGTLPNQTLNGLPTAAVTSGDQYFDGSLSYLPGQRLSACTCKGEEHPGPINRDGTFVGRSAPEIDVLEAQVGVEDRRGHVSQSGQWAPFDAFYSWNNQSYAEIYDHSVSELNLYRGSVYQQASSVISYTNQDCYELNTGCYSIYGFEYKPGYEEDNAYITWINDGKTAWRLGAGGMGANPLTEIAARPVPKEPMYIILNLGLSENFGEVDFENLVFPTKMYVDWVRVYQHPDRINVGCDPDGFPTSNYINHHMEAYTNPNLTTWVDDYGQQMPRNRLIDDCE
ncbi:beta-glucan synthesis-associated protein [Serendipita sp. 401]|nr:beta-glucan synthesis-associated protein [Serendipita sp. 401]KAG9058162.1 beta-glucan synthesis-associated protein [Serendipita sp. 407]